MIVERVGDEGERTVLMVVCQAMSLVLATAQSGEMGCGGSCVAARKRRIYRGARWS